MITTSKRLSIGLDESSSDPEKSKDAGKGHRIGGGLSNGGIVLATWGCETGNSSNEPRVLGLPLGRPLSRITHSAYSDPLPAAHPTITVAPTPLSHPANVLPKELVHTRSHLIMLNCPMLPGWSLEYGLSQALLMAGASTGV